MADLRINPTKLEGLLRKYRPEATTRDGVGGTTEFVMLCPFHNDSNASFHLNLHKGIGHCFSCPTKKAHTLEETIAILEGKSTRQAASLLRAEGIYEKAVKEVTPVSKEEKEESCGIKPEQLDLWHMALIADAAALAEITQVTGWTVETMRKWRIGYNGQRFTIPFIMNGVVTNVKYYLPHGQPKYMGEKSYNKPRVWPLESFDRPGTLWLMEGEKDCLLALQCGLAAVTFTGGAGKIPVEYLIKFKGRDVNIVYDIDPAGRSGATLAAEFLIKVANSVRIIDIPPDGLPPNGDFTDFVHHAKHSPIELVQIERMTETVKPRDNKTKVVIPDEVHDTYLENVITNKMFFKRVRMRVRVVSMAQTGVYLVPKEAHMNCSRNLGDQCHVCALNNTEGQPVIMRMKPEYPEILQLIDNDDAKQRLAIKSLMDVYPKCPKVRFDFKSFQAFYPIVLIPALEKDKATHSYTMQIAWALDVPAETNEDYLAEAVIMTHPDTQALVILCYKLDKDLASVDAFELTDDLKKELEVFQCASPILQPS
jgi:hypothetical protein